MVGLKTLIILELLSCCLGSKLEGVRVSYKTFTYKFIIRVAVAVESWLLNTLTAATLELVMLTWTL